MKVKKNASRMAPWSVKMRRSVGEALRRELDGPGTAADDDGMKKAKNDVQKAKTWLPIIVGQILIRSIKDRRSTLPLL
jgi:hypothetical protein